MYNYTEILREAEGYNFDKVKEMLRQNIREEGARSAGRQGQQKIIDRLMKDNKNGANKALTKAQAQDDGRFAFTDGKILFICDTDFGYEVETERAFKTDRLMQDVNANICDSATLDKAEIQTFIKLAGLRRNGVKNKAYIVKTDKGQYMGYNPFYLIDFIDFTGSAKILVDTPIRPAKSDVMDAIVLPANIREKAMNDENYQKWREENL